MAFFLYKDIKKNRNKPGVWLRVSSMADDDDFVKALHGAGVTHGPDDDMISHIKIASVEDGWAEIQVWVKPPLAVEKYSRLNWKELREARKPYVATLYRVVIVQMPENPEWVCESDVGRGYVEGRRK